MAKNFTWTTESLQSWIDTWATVWFAREECEALGYTTDVGDWEWQLGDKYVDLRLGNLDSFPVCVLTGKDFAWRLAGEVRTAAQSRLFGDARAGGELLNGCVPLPDAVAIKGLWWDCTEELSLLAREHPPDPDGPRNLRVALAKAVEALGEWLTRFAGTLPDLRR